MFNDHIIVIDRAVETAIYRDIAERPLDLFPMLGMRRTVWGEFDPIEDGLWDMLNVIFDDQHRHLI